MNRVLFLLFCLLLALGCSGPAPESQAQDPLACASTLPRVRPFVFIAGQSNALGASKDNRPPGFPDATVPYWRQDYYYNDAPHAFGPLSVASRNSTFGVELTLARALQARGFHPAIVKLGRGSTLINRWIPSAAYGQLLLAELAEAWASAHALDPEATWVPIFVWYQGESDAIYWHQTKQAQALAYVQQWSENFALIRGAVEGVIGPTFPYIMATRSDLPGRTFPGVIEAEQAASVDFADHLLPTMHVTLNPDGKHVTGLGMTILGSELGELVASDLELGRLP